MGFRLIEARDSTRAFRAKRDIDGRLAGETSRPVRIALWYPARTSAGQPRMTAFDFRILRESEVDFRPRTPEEGAEIRRRTLDLAGRFGLSAEVARERLEDRTPAVRDAPPVPGPHPTVLYAGAAYVSDPLTPAYLASYGFAVAAFPNNGRMTETSLEFSPNPLTLDTGIDDAGFAFAALRHEPLADTERVAVYAFSATSLQALLWVMRDLQADAVVSVEGWERFRRGADLVRTSPHYDPLRVRVPVLLIERSAAETAAPYAKVPDVVDSLAYAPRTRVAFDGAEHGDFLSHALGVGSPERERIYAASMRLVREFLEEALGGEGSPGESPVGVEGFYSVRRSRPAVVAPSEEEMFRMAEIDPTAFAETWRELRALALDRPPFREHVLARVARFTEPAEDRVVLWRVVADAYPASTVARFRLGESLLEAGRSEAGRRILEEALLLVEGDSGLDEEDRARWRERIEEAIESPRDDA